MYQITLTKFNNKIQMTAETLYDILTECQGNIAKEGKYFCYNHDFLDEFQTMDIAENIELIDEEENENTILNFSEIVNLFRNRVYLIIRQIATDHFTIVPEFSKFADALYYLNLSEVFFAEYRLSVTLNETDELTLNQGQSFFNIAASKISELTFNELKPRNK